MLLGSRGLQNIMVHHLLDGKGLADNKIAYDFYTHFFQNCNLIVYDFFGQPEFRDPVNHHAAGLVKGLEDSNIVPGPGQIRCSYNAARPGTDDRNPFAGSGGNGWNSIVFTRTIRDKPLKSAD